MVYLFAVSFTLQDTVSVHRPSFYADRFFRFMSTTVFRKTSCELNLYY